MQMNSSLELEGPLRRPEKEGIRKGTHRTPACPGRRLGLRLGKEEGGMERASSDAVAWIELHQTLPQSGKLMRLKRELRIRTPQAVGHLCLLWLWALDNASDGDLTRFTAQEIAEVCQYTGRPQEKLLQALVTTGFVDEDLRLHDWGDYTGRLNELREMQRIQARDRQRKRREKLRQAREEEAALERDVTL